MTSVRAVGYFGKLPGAGDFQRHGIETPWARRLFDWCVDGWSQSLAGGGVRDLDGPVRLVLRLPDADRFAALLLQPSRDRVGRRFPFVVVGELTAPGASWGEAVLLAAAWLQHAGPVAELASRGLDPATARAHVEALRSQPAAADLDRHREWRRTTTARDLLSPDATGGCGAFVRAIEYARSPAGVPQYVVRGAAAAPIDALAATVDLFARVGRHPVRAAGFEPRPAGGTAFRLLCDELQTRYLRPLLFRDAPSDLAWDIAPESSVPASFTGRIGGRIDPDAATVAALLEAASDDAS